MEDSEDFSEISRNMKKVTMCAIWFSTFACGLVYNFLPSVLIELKNKFETTIDDISKVFTVLFLAYLLGALLCGVLFNYINRQLTVVCILYLMAVGIILVPYVASESLFFMAGGIIGFTTGGYDTSQVAWVLELWHGEPGVYIQAEYFCYALSAFASPMLAKPFLQAEDISSPKHFNTTSNKTFEGETSGRRSQLHIPTLISGGIAIAAGTIIFILFVFKRYKPPTRSNSSSSSSISPAEQSEKRNRWVLIALCALLLGCYQGMEYCTLQFIPTFAHYIDLKLSEPDAAAVLSGLTGALTVGRFLGILARLFKVRPVGILAGNLTCMVAGNMVLLFWANESLVALWAGCIVLGLGFSTVFACVYDYIDGHLRVTNIVSSIMIVSGSAAGAVYPIFVGNAVEHSPFVLMHTISVSLAVCAAAFMGIYWLTRCDGRRKCEENCTRF